MADVSRPKGPQITQNQPRREKFLFEGADKLNFLRHKSASSINEHQRPESNKQVYLKMPSDYQEAYMNLVNQITGFFNEVREGLYEGSLNSKRVAQISEALEEVTTLDTIEGCIELLREAVLELVDTTNHIALYDYESLLQESESKVREHIRNEQQLKVAFESLQFKLNEAENELKTVKAELSKEIEMLVEDNSKLVTLMEKKDAELNGLYAELSQKDQTLEKQFQTMNKMIADFNNTQGLYRNAGEKLHPSLSNQKLSDYRPLMQLSQTTSHKYPKTPSPTKSLGIQKTMTPDNLHIVASFKVIRSTDTKKGEHSLTKDTVELGNNKFNTEETSETEQNVNTKDRSTKIILRTTGSKDPERGSSMKPPLKERSLQDEKAFNNLSQPNIKYKDLLAYGLKGVANMPEKLTSKEAKTKFIEELDKIFKMKRQNNSSGDLSAYASNNQPRTGRDTQNGGRFSNEVKDYPSGRRDITEVFNGQVIGSGVRQSARIAVEFSSSKKRPSSSLNNKHQDGSVNLSNSKGFAILKHKILGAKSYKA